MTLHRSHPLVRFLFLLVVVCSTNVGTTEALMVGKRRIQCDTPVGGRDTDALLEFRPTIPGVIMFSGFQALLPTLVKCPPEVQLFTRGLAVGGGFCPPEYLNLGASLPGVAIILGSLALFNYAIQNRLLVTKEGLGTASADQNICNSSGDLIPLSDIDEWIMTPVSLIVKTKSSSTNFFPLFWDGRSVEALMEDRLPNVKSTSLLF